MTERRGVGLPRPDDKGGQLGLQFLVAQPARGGQEITKHRLAQTGQRCLRGQAELGSYGLAGEGFQRLMERGSRAGGQVEMLFQKIGT